MRLFKSGDVVVDDSCREKYGDVDAVRVDWTVWRLTDGV